MSAPTLQDNRGSAGLPFTVLFFFAMLLLYVGERLILESVTARLVLDLLAAAGLAGALVGRVLRRQALSGEGRAVETRLLGLYLLGCFAVLLYFAQADFVMEWLRPRFAEAQSAERYSTVLSVLWPVLWLCAALPLVFTEVSYASMDVRRTIELARIGRSQASGLVLALTVCLLFAVNYISSELNEKVDLSYFKTTRPSESSKKMVQNLGEELQVVLFFPGANEVQEQAEAYFNELADASPRLKLRTVDHVMEPDLAKEHGVRDNGTVLLLRDKQKQQLNLGTTLLRAKKTLKKLDGEFQTAFLKLSRSQKVAYLTVGHEERAQRNREDKEGGTINTMRKVLERLNYSIKDLGIGQGLASAVPDDATVVIVTGPREAFLPAEVSALKKYLLGGGRMLVLLDPEANQEMAELLGPFGLKFTPVKLANERFHVRLTYTPADRNFLFSNRFASHPSISTLSRNSRQVATVLLGAGPLEKIPSSEGHKPDVQFTLHSMAYTWNDLDNNRTFNPPAEQQKIYELAAAATMKVGGGKQAKDKSEKDEPELRLIVVGDSDLISDKIIQNPGNVYFLADAIKWLGGEEELMGQTTSEEDVKIMHTREEDQLWFYLTIFGIPALVLTLGLYYTTRRRRRS